MTDFQARRQDFGATLRGLRERHGLSQRVVADDLGWPQSKVAKLERGRQTADDADVEALCRVLDADDLLAELLAELRELRVQQVEWRRELREGHRAKQVSIEQREQHAGRIRAVDVAAVTGLVQTPDYARWVFTSQADLLDLPDDADEAVAARMQRQQILYDPGKAIEILIGEAALAHPIAPAEVMAAQIDRLVSLIGLRQLRFGIVPRHRRLPHILAHGYWIVDELVTVETTTSELHIDDPDQVATYHRLTDRLWDVAAEGDAARAILTRAASDLSSA